jgi:DNA-binding PadR family transcriptional regulator
MMNYERRKNMHRFFEPLAWGHHAGFNTMSGHRRPRGHFGGRGAGGMGLRKGKLLTSDWLQLIALQLLSEKPRHGYEIIKAIEEHCSGVYSPSPGMIYPMLTYLEELSYATAEVEGTKKLFQITDAGKEHLEQNREEVTEILDQLKRYGEKMAYFQNQMEQEEAADQEWGGSFKEQEKKEWRKLKAEFHELRHELKAALFEKLNAPMEEKRRVLAILRDAITEIRKKQV